MSEWRERTEAEREAARVERERRRAEREAAHRQRHPIVLDPVPRDPVPGDPVPRDPVPHDPVPRDPVPPEAPREPAREAPVAADLQPGAGLSPTPPEPEAALAPSEPDDLHPRPEAEEQGPQAEAGPHTDDFEAPAGTRRVPGITPPASRTRAQRPAPAGAPRPRRSARRAAGGGTRFASRDPAEGHAGPRRHSTVRRVLSLLALVLVGAFLWFTNALFQPFHGAGHGRVDVRIPPHSSVSQVGDLLARDGIVSSGFFFKLRAELDSSNLRAGTFHMQLGMSYGAALKVLTTLPPPVKTSELTIAEGETRQHVARLLSAQHIAGSYLRETIRSPLLNPRSYGAPAGLPSLEGFLFPSTYQLRDPIRTSDLVADQLRAFKQNFATVNLGYARSKHLTAFDVLTIASIVQGEAQTLHDMPLVASVIYNRLHDHMMLAMDSTTRYAVNNYTSPLTVSQLASPSPYNTRNHFGLPLGPIDNPGMAAIQAAAHPASTNYLFFVAKPCGNGASLFTASQTQFEQYVQQYQNARASHGGRSPTHC